MLQFNNISEEKHKKLEKIDYDSFVFSINTNDISKGFQKLNDIVDFSNLDKIHEILSNKNWKVISKFKVETPKKFL